MRVNTDTRDNYTPGWKYNYWELRVGLYCMHGVPVLLLPPAGHPQVQLLGAAALVLRARHVCSAACTAYRLL